MIQRENTSTHCNGGGDSLSSIRQQRVVQHAVNTAAAMDTTTNDFSLLAKRPPTERPQDAADNASGPNKVRASGDAAAASAPPTATTVQDATAVLSALKSELAQVKSMSTTLQTIDKKLDDLSARFTAVDDQLSSLQTALDAALQENSRLKDQLRKQAEEHDQQMMDLRANQYDVLMETRAGRLAEIERNIVLFPKAPREAGEVAVDKKIFGTLTKQQIAAYLAISADQIAAITKFPVRREGDRAQTTLHRQGEECGRIEVKLKHLNDKKELMKSVNRKAREDRPCDAPLKPPSGVCKLQIKDALLPEELREKGWVDEVAMQFLRAEEEDKPARDRKRYSWRRGRATWFVPTPDGNGAAWALLSHLELPPGIDEAGVKRVARRAEERAVAAAASRRSRNHQRDPGAVSDGTGRATGA